MTERLPIVGRPGDVDAIHDLLSRATAETTDTFVTADGTCHIASEVVPARVFRRHVEVLQELERLRAVVGDREHRAEMRATGFGLQHPVECRPNLIDCLVNRALETLSSSPVDPGRYLVRLGDDGALTFDPDDGGSTHVG